VIIVMILFYILIGCVRVVCSYCMSMSGFANNIFIFVTAMFYLLIQRYKYRCKLYLIELCKLCLFKKGAMVARVSQGVSFLAPTLKLNVPLLIGRRKGRG